MNTNASMRDGEEFQNKENEKKKENQSEEKAETNIGVSSGISNTDLSRASSSGSDQNIETDKQEGKKLQILYTRNLPWPDPICPSVSNWLSGKSSCIHVYFTFWYCV